METMFIEAKSTAPIIPVVKRILDKLPDKIGIVTTIQHLYKMDEVKKFLEENKRHPILAGQILGCDAENAVKIKDKVNAFLYIGSGEFHPINVALETGKKVFIANPVSGGTSEITNEDIEKIKKSDKIAMSKFMFAKEIGILVSTKPGQENLKKAIELKNKLKDKNCYIFIADTIDFSQLQNFNFIECWVNTTCPRIKQDRKDIINLKDVEELIK
jgi:2-(3-amino-3-carboxypropyl)histidine synthase